MTKRMLIDATHKEETRVAITDGNKLVEYDYESQSRKPLKGSIFLAKVTRVEPSLQAAFVNFGGNRHGFLPFSEIHPDYFRIPVADREALMAEQEALIQELDEEEDALDDDADDSNEEEEEVVEPEVVGGELGAIDDDAPDGAAEEKPKAKAKKNTKKSSDNEVSEDADAEGEVSGDSKADAEADDAEGNDAQSEDQGSASAEGDDQEESGDKNKNNRRNHRGNGRGRGRGNGRGGRGRAQNRNRSVEVVGGEEIDEEQRFRFNLRRKYKIQEVIKRGQIMLVQANKEERGNKGAAVGSYLSLPGRYCVLMPNSPRAGGVSRKIANHKDRARMREIVKDLEVPKGMSVIVRTAGVTRTKVEIKRDLDYLMRLWDNIRSLTLESTAPAMVYEEADLIKRSVRDLYTRDVEEILVSGQDGYDTAKSFMKMMIPSHVKKVKQYEHAQLPLFNRYQIESQIDEIGQTEVRLRSGGYLVINPTEALVSIDVNSGKSTKGRHIEETALKTNLEAADEVARQLKLRDLGGLVVIDFIDMEDRRSNGKVERRMKEALSSDRARVQVGRISSFGLMELSRQRLSPSLTEAQYEQCSKCNGLGLIRTADAMSILVLRAIEEEGIRARASQIIVEVTGDVALYILNYKRKKLAEIETRYNFQVLLRVDDEIASSEYRMEVSKPATGDDEEDASDTASAPAENAKKEAPSKDNSNNNDEDGDNNKRRRGRRGGRRRNNNNRQEQDGNVNVVENPENDANGNVAETPKKDADANTSDDKKSEGDEPKRRPRKKKSDDEAAPEKVEVSSSDVTSDDKVADDKKASDEVKEEKPKKRGRKKAEPKEDVVADAAPAEQEKTEEKPKPKARAKAKPKAATKKKEDSSEKADKIAEKQSEPANKDYEVVNQPPKEKKKGWWNRLTE